MLYIFFDVRAGWWRRFVLVPPVGYLSHFCGLTCRAGVVPSALHYMTRGSPFASDPRRVGKPSALTTVSRRDRAPDRSGVSCARGSKSL